MIAKTLNTSSLAAAAFALLGPAVSAGVDGFDRLRQHEPQRSAPVFLVQASADPVAASFVRMLEHEPNRTPPALPAGAAVDPLIAAVVWPLLRRPHDTVAGAAPAGCPAAH